MPPAGCSERTIALRPLPPPIDTDYRKWASAYIGALYAFADSETKRAETADCLDRARGVDKVHSGAGIMTGMGDMSGYTSTSPEQYKVEERAVTL